VKLVKVLVALGLAVASFGKVANAAINPQTPCQPFCTDTCGVTVEKGVKVIRWVGPVRNGAGIFIQNVQDPNNSTIGFIYEWYKEIARRIGARLENTGVINAFDGAVAAVCNNVADIAFNSTTINQVRLASTAYLMTNAYANVSLQLLTAVPELLAQPINSQDAIKVYRQRFIEQYGREPIFMGLGNGSRQTETLVANGVPRSQILNLFTFNAQGQLITAKQRAAGFITDPNNIQPGQIYDAYYISGVNENYPADVPAPCRLGGNVFIVAAGLELNPPVVIGLQQANLAPEYISFGSGNPINPNCCELLLEMQCALDSMIADGTFDAIYAAALANPVLNPDPTPCDPFGNLTPPLHASADRGYFTGCDIVQDCGKDSLRMGTCVGDKPWEFLKDGRLVGYDVDVAVAIAKVLGKKLVIKNYPKSWLIPGVLNNAFDVALSHLAINADNLSNVAMVQYNGDALAENPELVGVAVNPVCCQLYADIKAAVVKLQENGVLPALRAKWKETETK
jgi:ABC-type amino acid transport substrate-binding protein